MAKAWNKGIPRTDEEKRNISIGRKLAIKKYGHPRGMLGKKHSQETIEKIRSWRPTAEQRERQKINSRIATRKRFEGKGQIKKLVKCLVCGKEKYVRKREIGNYCSYKCCGFAKRKNVCIDCKNLVSHQGSVRCRGCYRKWCKGENSGGWKGGVSKPNKLFRETPEYKEWRKGIFERDDYTCQMCKVRGGKLQADHIERFATNLEKRLDLKNGRTLCENCHKKTPNYGNRGMGKIRGEKGRIISLINY
jgi:hypothetical protein